MEEESEKGFAHFVEHMAFNGTKHFPAGSLIPFFQENGMSFGGDTNAHTSLAETVYKLNLAKDKLYIIGEAEAFQYAIKNTDEYDRKSDLINKIMNNL